MNAATHLNPDRQFLLEHIALDKRIVRAEGHYLYDEAGREYLDCLAQYGAVPFGHNPAFLWEVLNEVQRARAPSLVQPLLSPAAERLASRLVELAPGDMHYVTFTNSGAECVEAAIKLARARTRRQTILATTSGFHGKTLGAVSATGNPLYREPFRPDTGAFEHVPFDDLAALEARLRKGGVAAFIVEPVQGEGGMRTPSPGYLGEASRLCREHGTLFVLDEVQTGMGRTGALFAAEHEPGMHIDVLLCAKALGGGLLPLGAMLCRENAWSSDFGLYHSSTFANNHLTCSVGLAALERVVADGGALLAHVRDVGAYLGQRLAALVEAFPQAYAEARGAGLMRGLVLAPWSGERSYLMSLASHGGNAVALVCGYLLNERGILTALVFNHSQVLRLEPSLTITPAEVDRLIDALREVGSLLTRENYAALFVPVVGEPSGARKELLAGLDFTAPGPARAPRAGERCLGRFAFLIHPTEFDDLLKCQPPAFELFDGLQQEKWRAWLASWSARRYAPGVAYHLPALHSRRGGYVEGWLIACPLTPAQMMRLPPPERRKLVEAFLAIARDLEVDMLGLGAFTSVITRAGSDIADCGLTLTTGNSLTAMVSAESLLAMARARGLVPQRLSAGVIGAAGSVGRLACLRLAHDLGTLVLLGNPANPKSTAKLERLGGELYREVIRRPDRETPAGVGARLFELREAAFWRALDTAAGTPADLFHAVAAAFAEAGLAAPIRATTDLGGELPALPLLVTATSQGVSFIDPADLAAGAIVCDAARPPDVRKQLNGSDAQVSVYEGGLVRLPEPIGLGKDNVLGFPEGINLACLSETIALTFAGARRNFSIGMDVALEEARYVYETALAHGFEIALPEPAASAGEHSGARLAAAG